MDKLGEGFFGSGAEIVAKELLWEVINRKTKEGVLRAKIVETEAYYGKRTLLQERVKTEI